MPQFSLKRLGASAVAIAIGIAFFVFLFRSTRHADFNLLGGFALWLAGGTMIGAGAGALFSQMTLGAVLGFIVQIFFLIVLFWIAPMC